MAKATRRTDGISFRSFDNAWYSSLTGKYLPLKNEAGQKIKGNTPEAELEALRIYRKLNGEAVQQAEIAKAKATYLALIGEPAPAPAPKNAITVGVLCDSYLKFLKANRAPSSYDNAKETVVAFLRFVGDGRKAAEIGRYELRNFLDSKPTWGNARQGAAIAVVVASYNYGIETGSISANPFNKFKKPIAKPRVVLLSPEQEQAVYSASKKPFADYFSFLILSGARPDEGARVEAKHLVETAQGLQVVLQDHKAARKTGKNRVIYLNPEAATIVREWAGRNPRGPIFTRSNGKGWNDKARVSQWERIRNKIQREKGKEFFPTDLVLYSTRHTFATRKLAGGTSVAVTAALCGNTPRMIESVYGHLNLCGNLLWAAVQGTPTVAPQAPTVQAAT